jgi:hypothetical protein
MKEKKISMQYAIFVVYLKYWNIIQIQITNPQPSNLSCHQLADTVAKRLGAFRAFFFRLFLACSRNTAWDEYCGVVWLSPDIGGELI